MKIFIFIKFSIIIFEKCLIYIYNHVGGLWILNITCVGWKIFCILSDICEQVYLAVMILVLHYIII